jgi:hypothetical protein
LQNDRPKRLRDKKSRIKMTEYMDLRPRQVQGEIVVLPNKMMSLEFLQSIYRDETQSLHVRMRAAAIALPFESPKLAVTASIPLDETFAGLLDRARKRSARVISAPIEARPAPEPPPPPQDKWLPTVPDMRRFRRRF